MLLNLIISVLVGVSVFGCVYALATLTGGRIPKSFALIAGAVSVIVYQIYQEQTWHKTALASLPDGVIELRRETRQEPYRPWTYIWPRVSGIVAMDQGAIRPAKDNSSVRIADIYLLSRMGITGLPLIFDCANTRYTEMRDNTVFTEKGLPEAASWYGFESDPVMTEAACL